MHNINFIRENATAFDNAMKQRGETPCSVKIIKIDEEKRNTITKTIRSCHILGVILYSLLKISSYLITIKKYT